VTRVLLSALLCACISTTPGRLSASRAQTQASGQQSFVSRCAGCHGTDGNGGELGPAISTRVPVRTDEDLTTLFREGLTAAGMPAFANIGAAETQELIRYIRTLRPREGAAPYRTKVSLAGGGAIEGVVLNQRAADLQLLGDDRRIHLF